MIITNLGIINDKLETPEGTINAPTTFYMEVLPSEIHSMHTIVPITYETYRVLSDLEAQNTSETEE